MAAYTEVPSNTQPIEAAPTDPLALTFLLLFAASEVIGKSKVLKANGVIQLILNLIGSLKPVRKEDEIISSLHKDILDLTESVEELRQAVKPTRSRRSVDER